ncbi:formylglycine-generating enzyme family protein [Sorangium sp. So ce131]|uniref:formylglycine-generating enzyme family protein n=1 Tax=Sorangium sp. So ce131 TaxID=3133282 RepID=UPI003F6168BB
MRKFVLITALSLLAGCSPKKRDFGKAASSGSGDGGGGSNSSSQGSGGDGSSSGGDGSGGDGSSGGGGDGASSSSGGSGGCVNAVSDCPPPRSACVDPVCREGRCAELSRPEGTPCGESGSAACDVAGACVECAGGTTCGTCPAPGCPTVCGSEDVAATPPSCRSGTASVCGSGEGSCCDNRLVRCGNYLRSYDGVVHRDTSHPAAVSDFRLDRYKITVGRFREFVKDGRGVQANPPMVGVGAHPRVSGTGWHQNWKNYLALTTAELKAALHCDLHGISTWTDEPGPNETLPINCINWYEAFAFCAWDGGRLPSEAELNYAAAGGDWQREYPWGSGIDGEHAVYRCTADGSVAGDCTLNDILPVGSMPLGDGRWGHSDLAGNLWEWAMDWWSEELFLPCLDCVFIGADTELRRVTRGGSFRAPEGDLRVAERDKSGHEDRVNNIGARCARDP